jgi:hypothetical protein
VAELKIAFLYEDTANPKERPSSLYYRFELFVGEKLVRIIVGMFENEAHGGGKLAEYEGDLGAQLESCWYGETKHNFVTQQPPKYHLVRSCRVNPEASTHYGPRILAPSDPRYGALESQWSTIGNRK